MERYVSPGREEKEGRGQIELLDVASFSLIVAVRYYYGRPSPKTKSVVLGSNVSCITA